MAVKPKKATKSKSKKTTKKTEEKAVSSNKGLALIEKEFGKNTISIGKSYDSDFKRVSTGLLGLDKLFGIDPITTRGGVPVGRLIEVYGPESSGKTAINLLIAGAFLREGYKVGFIDMERSLTRERCVVYGINPDDPNFYVSEPKNGEDALNIIRRMSEHGVIDYFICDSVPALTPKAEVEGDVGDSNVAAQARMMSQALRKMILEFSETGVGGSFINQLRMKIGVMFGNPETTPAGNALKFYCSVRMDVRKTGFIKDGEVVVGQTIKVKTVKNKTAAAQQTEEFQLYYDRGLCKYHDLVTQATKYGVIEKAGAWYKYNGDNLGQGMENTKATLFDNPELFDEIFDKTSAKIAEPKPNPFTKTDPKEEAPTEESSGKKEKAVKIDGEGSIEVEATKVEAEEALTYESLSV